MSHIEIAKKAILKPIAELAQEKLGIETRHFDPYGQYKAKLSLEYTGGKTITTVGLGDALNRLGIGALAVGNVKYHLQQTLLRLMLESEKPAFLTFATRSNAHVL